MESLHVVRSKQLFNGELLNYSRSFTTEKAATTYIEWLKSKGHEVLNYSHYVNFSKETLDLIKRTPMIEGNGCDGTPNGSFFCPICGGSDIEHNEHCPVFLLNR